MYITIAIFTEQQSTNTNMNQSNNYFDPPVWLLEPGEVRGKSGNNSGSDMLSRDRGDGCK
jgi:hypothetical protein